MRHTALDDPRLIAIYRMSTLRHALKLEIHGMRRKGRSAYAIIKAEFKLRGSRKEVLREFTEMCELVIEKEKDSGLSHQAN